MNIEYEKQMGNNIRQLRMYYELTQEQLSAKLQTKGIDITRKSKLVKDIYIQTKLKV